MADEPDARTMTRPERDKALSNIVSLAAARENAARNAAQLTRLQAKHPPAQTQKDK